METINYYKKYKVMPYLRLGESLCKKKILTELQCEFNFIKQLK